MVAEHLPPFREFYGTEVPLLGECAPLGPRRRGGLIGGSIGGQRHQSSLRRLVGRNQPEGALSLPSGVSSWAESCSSTLTAQWNSRHTIVWYLGHNN